MTHDASHLLNKKLPKIVMGDLVFTVDNSVKTYRNYQKRLKKVEDDAEILELALEVFLGKEQVKTLDTLNLSMSSFTDFAIYVFACVQGSTFEKSKETFSVIPSKE